MHKFSFKYSVYKFCGLVKGRKFEVLMCYECCSRMI